MLPLAQKEKTRKADLKRGLSYTRPEAKKTCEENGNLEHATLHLDIYAHTLNAYSIHFNHMCEAYSERT